MSRTIAHITALGLMAALATACGDGVTEPAGGGEMLVGFTPSIIDFGDARGAEVRLENRGNSAVGSIRLVPGPVTDTAGDAVAGVQLQALPVDIATLEAGESVPIDVSLVLTATPPAGRYRASLEARAGGDSLGALAILFRIASPPPPGSGTSVAITGGPASPRQGDVATYTVEVRDSTDALISDSSLTWSVLPSSAGLLKPDGRFVGYVTGAARIVATVDDAADTLSITVTARGVSDPSGFTVVGRGVESSRFTSDLWVQANIAYTGTWTCRDGIFCGDRLIVWDVSNPAAPIRVDEIVVDAQIVNDVKVRSDGAIAVITHESSSDQLNGITLLDLSDPAHPQSITRFTAGLEAGVHNVWIEGDYVYAAVDGGGSGLRVLDISDPGSPILVASYYAGSSFLHDVYVRDGLAFLSHWDAGLVILDVGHGIAGGSPQDPVEVSRIVTAGGQTHNAWYWPAAGYVFVGEEDYATPGIMHVIDVNDLEDPIEVATFGVTGTTPHNFWLDEDRAILYLAWYENGLRALDVSGVLMGQLDRQGRQIASIQTGSDGCPGGVGTACAWAPQLYDGLVYVSDMSSGLWVVRPEF